VTRARRDAEESAQQLEDQPLHAVRAEAERRHILSVLRLVRGNRERAARILGISRKTLWKKLKRLDLHVPHVTGR
jgi:two-component system, NtrC family, response regulator HydG